MFTVMLILIKQSTIYPLYKQRYDHILYKCSKSF